MSDQNKSPALAGTKRSGQASKDKQNVTRTAASCHACGQPLPASLQRLDWLEELQLLAARYSHFGFGPDLAALTVTELYGLYRWLSQVGS